MPLTPNDVRTITFSNPPMWRRGYNKDEVNAFMDLVEAELARLNERVKELEERLHGD